MVLTHKELEAWRQDGRPTDVDGWSKINRTKAGNTITVEVDDDSLEESVLELISSAMKPKDVAEELGISVQKVNSIVKKG